jgi:hypothetical protein
MIQRQVIKPQIDVPLVVQLGRGPEGVEKAGKYGVDYQYIVNNGAGVMWLPKEGRDALIRSGARAGDEVEIVKSMRGKQAVFSAQVVSDAAEPPVAPAPARQIRVVAPQPSYTNGNGTTAAGRQQAPESHPMEDLLTRCFVVAAHALRRAHTQLAREGFELDPPNWEDIRPSGATLFIERNKREREAQR